MLNMNMPRLTFLKPNIIANGVTVNAVHFDKEINPPFQMTYFQVMPGCTTPRDQHRVQEIWIVLQGRGILNYEDQSYHLTANDIVHFSSLKCHHIHNNIDTPLVICSLYW